MHEEERLLVPHPGETRQLDGEPGQSPGENEDEDHAEGGGVRLERPAVGQVEGDGQQNGRADDADAHGVFADEDVRDDVADDDQQAEGQAEQTAKSFPFACDDDGEREGQRQPAQRRRADVIREIGIEYAVRSQAEADEDHVAHIEADALGMDLAFAVVHFHGDAGILAVEQFHAQKLVGLCDVAEIDLALFEDERHFGAGCACPHRRACRFGEGRLEEIGNAPNHEGREEKDKESEDWEDDFFHGVFRSKTFVF